MKEFILCLVAITLWVASSNAFVVTIDAKTDGKNKPSVTGITNLPDGTDLMISIIRKESSYSGGIKSKVLNGKFNAGPFSQYGNPLNPGKYSLEITVPYAQVQPKRILPLIGNRGEKLEGPLSKKEALGRLVKYKTSFKIDGVVSIANDKEAKKKDKAATEEWKRKSCADICSLSQINSGISVLKFDFDGCMAKCLK